MNSEYNSGRLDDRVSIKGSLNIPSIPNIGEEVADLVGEFLSKNYPPKDSLTATVNSSTNALIYLVESFISNGMDFLHYFFSLC